MLNRGGPLNSRTRAQHAESSPAGPRSAFLPGKKAVKRTLEDVQDSPYSAMAAPNTSMAAYDELIPHSMPKRQRPLGPNNSALQPVATTPAGWWSRPQAAQGQPSASVAPSPFGTPPRGFGAPAAKLTPFTAPPVAGMASGRGLGLGQATTPGMPSFGGSATPAAGGVSTSGAAAAATPSLLAAGSTMDPEAKAQWQKTVRMSTSVRFHPYARPAQQGSSTGLGARGPQGSTGFGARGPQGFSTGYTGGLSARRCVLQEGGSMLSVCLVGGWVGTGVHKHRVMSCSAL